MHSRDVHSSSWNFQMAISPLSLHEARNPASFGFQDTQLTSWLWALATWAASENTGSSGLAVSSSLKTRTASSPEAVAKAPVSRHLQKDLGSLWRLTMTNAHGDHIFGISGDQLTSTLCLRIISGHRETYSSNVTILHCYGEITSCGTITPLLLQVDLKCDDQTKGQ